MRSSRASNSVAAHAHRDLGTAVEVHGRDARLERARQKPRLVAAARALLAAPEPQPGANADRARDQRQALLAHQVGAPPRQFAGGRIGEALEQQRRDRPLQHRVAHELQALVVGARETRTLVGKRRVRERVEQQRAVREGMRKAALDCGDRVVGLGHVPTIPS